MKLFWSRRAQREFREAVGHLEEANPEAALRWRTEVQRMMQMIEDHPRIGRFHRSDLDGEIDRHA